VIARVSVFVKRVFVLFAPERSGAGVSAAYAGGAGYMPVVLFFGAACTTLKRTRIPESLLMSLKERINEDMKTAMRAKAADKLGTIRLLLAAIKQKEVDERITLDDTATVAIVDKLIKQRKDSISQFEAAGRQDLADKEAAELAVLQVYMPQQLSADEVAQAVKAAVAQTGAAGPQDMGKVMGVLKSQLAGRADMTAVSAQVKAALAA
jgi:uncharacterized protein YqeY